MMAKQITLALAATALLVSMASAQTPTTATGDRANTPSNSVPESSLKGDWRASKVVGLNVYNDTNEKLGSINDLLMDKSGNIKAVVLGVGGFLGVGQYLVAVPLDKVKFVNEPVVYKGTANSGGGGTNSGGAGTMTKNPTAPPTTTGSTSTAPPQAAKPNPWYPDHAVFEATKDELKAMPEFKFSAE